MKPSVCFVILLSLLASACSAPNQSASDAYERAASIEPSATASMESDTSFLNKADHTIDSTLVDQEGLPILANKRLVIHASLNFDVKDVRASVKSINNLSAKLGGYIAEEQINNSILSIREVPISNGEKKILSSYQQFATVTVRIPKDKVGEFLEVLQSQIDFLHTQQFSAKDVSLDIQKAQISAQIEALKAQQIDQAHTDNALDTVISADQTAQARLAKLAAELDQKYLEDQVAFATLMLEFRENEKIHTTTKPNIDALITQEQSTNFGARLGDSLRVGWYGFLELVVFLTRLWVFVLILPVLWLAFKGVRRFFRARRSAPKTPKAPTPKEPDTDAPS